MSRAQISQENVTSMQSWSIPNVEGARRKVLEAIERLTDVPEWGKAVVIAAIKERPADVTFIYVDAHFHSGEHGGTHNSTLHLTVQGTRALV